MLRQVNSNTLNTPPVNVAAMQVSTVPVVVYKAQGYYVSHSNNDCYLQFFDGVTAANLVSGTTKPLKSLLLQANFVYDYHWSDGVTFKTFCQAVLSQTDNVFTTMVDGADLADMEVDIEEYSQVTTTPTVTSPASPGAVTSYQVWAEASGPKLLRSLQIVTGGGQTGYAKMYAQDAAPTVGQLPLQEWKVAASSTLNLNFGNDGSTVQALQGFTLRVGCTIYFDTTAGGYTGVTFTATPTATYI